MTEQVRTIVQKELDQLDQGFRQRPEIIVHREVDDLDDDEVVYVRASFKSPLAG